MQYIARSSLILPTLCWPYAGEGTSTTAFHSFRGYTCELITSSNKYLSITNTKKS